MSGIDEDLPYLKKLPHERVAPTASEFVPFIKVSVVSVDFLQSYLSDLGVPDSRHWKLRYPFWVVDSRIGFWTKYMFAAGGVYLSIIGTVMLLAQGWFLDSVLLLAYAFLSASAATFSSLNAADKAADRRRRCLRSLRRAIEVLSSSASPVIAIKYAGEASRMLRASLQAGDGIRRPPPVVSDYFDRLTSTMVDIRVDDRIYLGVEVARSRLQGMLLEFYSVISVGREDLLPEIRDRFSQVSSSGLECDSSLREINVEYVNSLHGLSRLDFIKEYWYPLAGWCSFVVALLALILK